MDNIHKNNGLFRCKLCNKNYSSYKSLWNHNKKFHNNIVNQMSNVVKNTSNNVKQSSNIIKQYHCSYCDKCFEIRQTRWAHEQKCKNINNKDKQIELLREENELIREEFNNAIIEIKKEFIDLLKNNNITSENLKQINNKVHNVNNKYVNCTVNNGQINNTYVKFGNLDYTKIFSEKEICSLMTNYKYKCLEEFIKKVHFNDKYPEYGNIFITNLRDNIAYIFDGKEFIASDKTDTIIELIDDHANEINLSLDNHKENLNDYTIKKIEDMLEKLESEDKFLDENNNKTYNNYKVYKINCIKKDIYNLSDRKKLELLQNINLFEKHNDEYIESENSITI